MEALYEKTYNTHSIIFAPQYAHMEAHSEKNVHIILHYNYAGFWSIFNKLMNYLVYYPHIGKITYTYTHSPSIHNFYGDFNFFDTVLLSYDSGKENLFIVDAKDYITFEATGSYANWLHVGEQSWRHKYHALFMKYIRIQPSVLAMVDAYIFPKKPLISILIRHPALRHEQIYDRMPTLEEYDTVIGGLLKEYGSCAFILATDVEEAHAHFTKKYAEYDIIHPFSIKTSMFEEEAQQVKQGNDMAKVAVATVLALAKGDHFIFPNSNMATAALYINPHMKAHFLGSV